VYKIQELEERYRTLERLLMDPGVAGDQQRYAELSREFNNLARILQDHRRLQKVEADVREYREMERAADDEQMLKDIQGEIARLERERQAVRQRIRMGLLPEDPMEGKNIIMEIRAGTGGEEASLFAADLFRMYGRYCERRRWKAEIMTSHETGVGGFKEIVFSVTGREVFRTLKFERGVHRVQRIPVTESGGRIHTSAVTVAMLPEAEETDVRLSPEDLRVDVFRARGHGGQHVNTTDSAVRITHLPTGVVVSCQDEKSQLKNKERAMKVLRARLFERAESARKDAEAAERRIQVGSGDRSERIRTYNFPQNRVTDHRIGLTLYKLDAILEGELDELFDALLSAEAEVKLRSIGMEAR
jgi:peptide chain release factor 1